jgi:predicted dinucleotide-utilizing enzyme
MTIKHVVVPQAFNEEQHMQMRADSFQTAGNRVYLFEGASVLVDIKTNTITAINRVQGMTFEPMIAVKRIAYYLGFVYYEGERHELDIRQPSSGLFKKLFSFFA